MQNRVLLVEDDPELGDMVAEYLRGDGFEVALVQSGEDALLRVANEEFAAMVLDVMLPGLSGFEVLRRARAPENPARHLPIVMLTARGDEVDRVLGLEMGADDYLPKPFSSRELAARLRAVLRRSGAADEAATPADEREIVGAGEFQLDVAAHSATHDGVPLELTALEFRLLELLLRHAGNVVTREQIALDVLGRTLLPYDRGVDTHISNLRRKLADENGADPIVTLRGTGYLFALPASSQGQI